MDSPQRILESLKEARSVSSNGRALVGQGVVDVMKAAGVNLTVVREIPLERGGQKVTEVEISLADLPESIPVAASEPSGTAVEAADVTDAVTPV